MACHRKFPSKPFFMEESDTWLNIKEQSFKKYNKVIKVFASKSIRIWTQMCQIHNGDYSFICVYLFIFIWDYGF